MNEDEKNLELFGLQWVEMSAYQKKKIRMLRESIAVTLNNDESEINRFLTIVADNPEFELMRTIQ
jgi:hypothetical protein